MWDFVSNYAPTVVLVLVVVACPLMHIFGHRHGGGHRNHDHRETRS